MTLNHEAGCNGRTFTKCESHLGISINSSFSEDHNIIVVRMEWCEDCRATDHEVVIP